MRNPNRTTKPERAAARRSCPTICRVVGVAAAARLRRQGLSDDATAFDRMFLALDLPPGLMRDGTGSHWSHAQNYAKTEDGRVVYIDPAEYERTSRQLMDDLQPHLDGMLDAELTAAGLARADYRFQFVEEYPNQELQPHLELLPEATTVTGLDGTRYAVSYDRIDLAAAPVGAPPFNTELFETYRREFDAATMQYTGLDNDGNPTGPTHQANGPVAITVEHLEENQAKWSDLAAAALRGAGTLQIPLDMALPDSGTDPRLADATRELLADPDHAADDAPAIVYTVPSTWACIVCGGPSEPNSTVCSAGCGYELTGEYPDLYEKDYGPEDVNPDA